jgi:hypothetical protein
VESAGTPIRSSLHAGAVFVEEPRGKAEGL